jgi:hypothetical protein
MPATMLGDIKTPVLIAFRLFLLTPTTKVEFISNHVDQGICVFVAERCETWAHDRCFRAVHNFTFPCWACGRECSVQRLTLLRQWVLILEFTSRLCYAVQMCPWVSHDPGINKTARNAAKYTCTL